jgi:hypothetical protein
MTETHQDELGKHSDALTASIGGLSVKLRLLLFLLALTLTALLIWGVEEYKKSHDGVCEPVNSMKCYR